MIDTVYDGKHERRGTSKGHLERLHLDCLIVHLGEISPSICLFIQRSTTLSFIFILQTTTTCLPPTTLMKCFPPGKPPGTPCPFLQTLPFLSLMLSLWHWAVLAGTLWVSFLPWLPWQQHLLLSPASLGSLLSHSQAPVNDGICHSSIHSPQLFPFHILTPMTSSRPMAPLTKFTQTIPIPFFFHPAFLRA